MHAMSNILTGSIGHKEYGSDHARERPTIADSLGRLHDLVAKARGIGDSAAVIATAIAGIAPQPADDPIPGSPAQSSTESLSRIVADLDRAMDAIGYNLSRIGQAHG